MRKLITALSLLLCLAVGPARATLFLGDDAQFHAIVGTTGDVWVDASAAPYNAKCDGVTDDTAAIQAAGNAAIAAGVSLYIPPSTNGCVVSRNGANNWCLQFTGPLVIWGIPNLSIIVPAAGTGSTISIIQFVGYADGKGKVGVYGLFIGGLNGQRSGGHALDFETANSSQAFPANSFIERNYFATPTSGSGYSIFASNTGNSDGGFARTVIKDNIVGSGIDLQGSGDSVKIDHNVFLTNGSNAANIGILANLVAGAGNLQVINNNCSIDNSCLEVDCATTIHVAGNEFEHSNLVSTNAVINISGSVCFVTGGDISQNQIQGNTGNGGTPKMINIDKGRTITVNQNRIAPPTNYIPVNLTANADTIVLGLNTFFNATTFYADTPHSTIYENAQIIQGHSLHSASCAGAGAVCYFLSDLSTTEGNVSFITQQPGQFKNLHISGPSPGASQNYIFVLMDNAGTTPVTCTISSVVNPCSDTTNIASGIAAGDKWDIRNTTSGGAAAGADFLWSVEFDPQGQ